MRTLTMSNGWPGHINSVHCSIKAVYLVRTNNDLGDTPRGANQELLDHAWGAAFCHLCHLERFRHFDVRRVEIAC